MEKDLLDISGEDDEDYWLLKNTPKKSVSLLAGGKSGREKSYLNCSPLQIPRSSRIVPTRPPFSPIGRVTGNNNMEQPCSSVDKDSVGKENTSGNKVELPKLSVERQQMKKKKKNAGFNLRKSLAWDRAFSTEEGVLDSSELSKITGTVCQFGGDLLPAIQEEFREMSASNCTSVSPGLRDLEENLFNDLPVNSKRREKKFVTGILPKYASPSKSQSSLAQKKVISAQDLRSGSKRSGCPRPPPSSSLKRPANVHTTQRSRELSISKASTTKSDPLTAANNMKRTTHSPSKPEKSQPSQLKNSQRSLGSVSFSKNTSRTKSKTKSSLANQQTSKISSISISQLSVVGQSNVGPMSTSDVAMLGHASNIPDSNVITTGTSLGQSSCNKVGSTQSVVSRLGKPSGLRMPSPSIGYFRQSESQLSHSAGDKHSQLPRSDVCSASRVSLIPTFKKPQVAGKVPGVNSKAATGNTGRSGSAAGFSAQPLKPSQEKVKVDLKSTREVESNVSYGSLSSQIYESLQHPSIIQGDTGKLVQDDVTICTSKKISILKCEELQNNSELPPSGCKNDVQDGIMSDDNRDEKKTPCFSLQEYCALPLKNGPTFINSMDSPMQDSSVDELTLFNNYSQLKVSNPGEEDISTLDVHGQPLNECVPPGNEDEISPFLSREKDVLIVYHSTENVAKQPEVLNSFTADPDLLGIFASIKGDVDDLSSPENQLGNTEYVFVPLGPAEAPNCVQSPCNHLEENAVLNPILCDHNMVCDGQAVLETKKRIEVRDSTETNCEADFIGSFPDCKNWFRESEEQHFSSQLVIEMKEGGHEIDFLTRTERADKDDGSDMQIEYFTGSSDAEQNMEKVKLLMPSSVEARMKIKPLESSHETFSEKLTSEMQKQYNCSSIANTSDVNDGRVMEQADQLRTLDGCSPEKDASATVLSYSNEELEDNSELEDMDLVTESDCSDEELEDNLEQAEVDVVTDLELISDLDEFSVKGIPNQEYPKVESIHTTSDLCGKPKTLLNESISSLASRFGDPECLNDDTSLSRISEGMSKEDADSGRIEQNHVGKAEIQTYTRKDFSTQVTDQETGPHEEDEESATSIPMNEVFSVRDDVQPDEFNVLSDDIFTSESNGASESTSSCTCASEGKDKMILLDAKLEKKPDPIDVKPPNAVPFSDEWLAAIEAAGEEILTLKSGRVQHSPTEKSAPEPGPWSPVKKKNNLGVGPFDCTKYNNKVHPPAFD